MECGKTAYWLKSAPYFIFVRIRQEQSVHGTMCFTGLLLRIATLLAPAPTGLTPPRWVRSARPRKTSLEARDLFDAVHRCTGGSEQMAFQWRFGVEEEYFLIDRVSGDACSAPSAAFWSELSERAPSATKELLQSQVEAKTSPCSSAEQCSAELQASRSAIESVAARHGLGLMASGTHPDFDWRHAKESTGTRYSKLVRNMRMLAMRNHFCGLHVHVEVPEGVSRVNLMNRCAPYLPLFLALSVSSPFWCGEWTGMHGYRLTGYDELPRTGIPPVFADEEDYQAYIQTLVRMGAISDESFLWWALRPSLRYPTLELRICDSVTSVSSAVALASFFRCLVFRLATDAGFGPRPSPSLRAIAEENRWQVQCDGLDAEIADVEGLRATTARHAISRLLASLGPEARKLRCEHQLDIVRGLLEQETSSERQINIWRSAESPTEGLSAVKAWLMTATMD